MFLINLQILVFRDIARAVVWRHWW